MNEEYNEEVDKEVDEEDSSNSNPISNAGEVAQGAAKKAAKKAVKKTAKKTAKTGATAAKAGSAAAGTAGAAGAGTGIAVAWPVVLVIIIIIILIIVIGGIIGFFTIMPGLYKDKIANGWATFWSNIHNRKDERAELQLDNMKKYLSDLGYDLVGFGFIKDPKNAEYEEKDDGSVEYPEDDNDKYLKSYIAAEINTYSFETAKSWLFGINKSKQGMIKVEGHDELKTAVFGENPKLDGTFKNGKVTSSNWIEGIFDSIFGENCYSIEIKNNSGTPILSVRTKKNLLAPTVEHNYDLKEWVEQYGMPSYFLTALHVGTLAPDFAYYVATEIQPKVEFELLTVEGVITKWKVERKVCEKNQHDWEVDEKDIEDIYSHPIKYTIAKNLLDKGDRFKSFKCSKCNVIEYCLFSASNNPDDNLEDGTGKLYGISIENIPVEADTLIPCIKEVKTWYKKVSYTNKLEKTDLVEVSEGDENFVEFDIGIGDWEYTVTSQACEDVVQTVTNTVEQDNSHAFRALLFLDEKCLDGADDTFVDVEKIKEIIRDINKQDKPGYEKVTGVVGSTEKYNGPIEPTSTMNYAIEMIENAPGSGPKIIARELKEILRDCEFVFADKDYPTTVEDAKIGTFEFILPDYFPTIWPTSAEAKGKYVTINYDSRIEDAQQADEQQVESFRVGERVIMPADGKIKSVTNNSITIEFTEQNSYGMQMTISGIDVDTENIKENQVYTRKTNIGITISSNISIILKDADNKICLASDYMDGVFLRYESVKAAGRVYPVYTQKEFPWGDVNFYKLYKNTVEQSKTNKTYAEESKTNKTYAEVGSGSTVAAIALSGLTKKQVLPSEISLKIREILINKELEDTGSYDATRYPNGYHTYVTRHGLSKDFFKSQLETFIHPITGEEIKSLANTNIILREYGVQTYEIESFDKVKEFTDQGFPVVIYAYTKNTKGKKDYQYYLLLQSENEDYAYYLIDPTSKNNNGQYTVEDFKEKIETEDSEFSAYALKYEGIGNVK